MHSRASFPPARCHLNFRSRTSCSTATRAPVFCLLLRPANPERVSCVMFTLFCNGKKRLFDFCSLDFETCLGAAILAAAASPAVKLARYVFKLSSFHHDNSLTIYVLRSEPQPVGLDRGYRWRFVHECTSSRTPPSPPNPSPVIAPWPIGGVMMSSRRNFALRLNALPGSTPIMMSSPATTTAGHRS